MANPFEDDSIEDKKEVLLNALKTFDGIEYFYQKATLRENIPKFAKFLETLVHGPLQKYERNGLPLIPGMDLDGDVKHYAYDSLKLMSESFSQNNHMYRTSYGRLFRGKIPEKESESGFKNVMVKTWDFLFPPRSLVHSDHPARLHDELRIMMDPKIKSNSNVVKLIGFHCEQTLAVVYEGEGSSNNLLTDILSSDNFDWKHQMMVATAVGTVLETLHNNNLVQGGVTACDILVDQAYNPMIFNFWDREENVSTLSHGSDVCAFAYLLLELIMKENIGDSMLDGILHGNLVVQNSFDIDEQLFCNVKNLTVKCLVDGRSRKTTTIVTFLDDLTNLVGETLPNKRRHVTSE